MISDILKVWIIEDQTKKAYPPKLSLENEY